MNKLRFYFSVGAVLLFFTAKAQKIDDRWPFKGQTIKQGPYIFPNENSSLRSEAGRLRLVKNPQRRPTGYVCETGMDFQKKFEVRLSYTMPSSMTYLFFSATDTSQMTRYEMDPLFDYNYKDVISLINPGGFVGYFLREQGGSIRDHFLSSESKQKIDGKWVLVGKAKDRIQVPYGFEYGYNYWFSNLCPTALEYQSKGEWEDGHWIHTLDITVRDCKTLAATESWREIRHFDEKRQNIEWSTYTKTEDTYSLEFRYSFKYDKEGREIEQVREGDYPDPDKLKKYVQVYDEKGNSLLAKYELNGTNWLQTSRTIAERTNDGSYLYTHQNLKSNVWQDSYREKSGYDVRGRVVYSSSERWNDVSKTWDLEFYDKNKYFVDELISEREYFSNYSNEQLGGKQLIEYDEKKMIKMTQSFECSGIANCGEGKYVPEYKAFYENRDEDELDYFTSYLFTNDHWVRFDSVANRYNDNNEIVESFSRSYDGNYPEKMSSQDRYTYTYDVVVVTQTEKQEKRIVPYPNPFDNTLHLDQDASDILISDVMGRELNPTKIDFQNEKTTIDMSNLLPGIYFVKVLDDIGKTRVHKVIKR